MLIEKKSSILCPRVKYYTRYKTCAISLTYERRWSLIFFSDAPISLYTYNFRLPLSLSLKASRSFKECKENHTRSKYPFARRDYVEGKRKITICRAAQKRERSIANEYEDEREKGPWVPGGFVTAGGLTHMYTETHISSPKNQHRRRQITTHIRS